MFEKKQYLNTFFEYNGFPQLKKISGVLPKFVINAVARLRRWQGRNIIAVFEKESSRITTQFN